MKFCVIGLGRFGHELATTLADNGMEVMAVDSNESIVASIRDHVTQAICMRVTDENSLRSIGVEEVDTVIVAMGENFAQSILITALLKKRLNIPHVIARAINDIHKEILKLVGADRMILPEQEIGIRLADTLSSPLPDSIRLTKNFSVSYLKAPKPFVDKSVGDLELFNTYEVSLVGRKEDETIVPVNTDYIITAEDTLILSGPNNKLEIIAKL